MLLLSIPSSTESWCLPLLSRSLGRQPRGSQGTQETIPHLWELWDRALLSHTAFPHLLANIPSKIATWPHYLTLSHATIPVHLGTLSHVQKTTVSWIRVWSFLGNFLHFTTILHLFLLFHPASQHVATWFLLSKHQNSNPISYFIQLLKLNQRSWGTTQIQINTQTLLADF